MATKADLPADRQVILDVAPGESNAIEVIRAALG